MDMEAIIAQEARKELARREYAEYVEFVHRGLYTHGRHTRLIAERLDAIERGELKRLMVFMPPRHSKALKLDTPIPTPDGWKTMKDLKIGDKVFAGDGTVTTVTNVSPIMYNQKVYRVMDDAGFSVIADAQHEWEVILCRKREKKSVKTTEWLYERQLKGRRKPIVVAHKGLDLPEKDLPIPPYTLGVWLGDGVGSCATISQNIKDQEHIKRRIKEEGFEVTEHSNENNFGVLGLYELLRKQGLLKNKERGLNGEKRIPDIYLRASKEQRLALLQGLIDTDGNVNKEGQVWFTNTNKEFSYQVFELIRSLGYKATIREYDAKLYDKNCGKYYRVSFYSPDAASLPRKKKRCRETGVRTKRHYITIEPIGYADVKCITVEHPSGTFLAGRNMIPTHNSMTITETFPSYFIGKNPNRRVIEVSYNDTFAQKFGKANRDKIREFGGELFGVYLSRDNNSKTNWGLEDYPGGMVSAGIGGSITGEGADLLIIDDPIKNRQEADSPVYRQRLREEWESTLLTRLQPGGAVILILTRWHEYDLAGQILEEEADKWEVISLPALAEENDILGRKPGEPLWPEFGYDEEWAAEKKKAVGSRTWNALYQQRPSPEEGGLVKRSWFKYYNTLPGNIEQIIMSVDCAFKGNDDNDYVVAQIWGRAGANKYLIDQVRDKTDIIGTMSIIQQLARKYPKAVTKLIEDKANGPAVIQMLRGRIPGLIAVNPEGGKTVRLQAVAPEIEAGNVYLPSKAPWVGDFVEEVVAFPNGRHDDQVDAMTQALIRWQKLPRLEALPRL